MGDFILTGSQQFDLVRHIPQSLAAARSGRLLNLSALGADAGIRSVTAREWIGVLEASYLVMRLPPYFENFGKRLVKTPKLYFLDTGLMCWLGLMHWKGFNNPNVCSA
ncbi:MAG TPA: DUF4143 domain-containing protein [Limnobacter sp.]|nr:DUF4143 domain-containing protein [Limnobacter sp.]